MEKVPEVLQVIRYLDHISGRQTGEDLLVDCQCLVHLGQTQDRVEPRNEVQTGDTLFGGNQLLCRKERERSQFRLGLGSGGLFSWLPPFSSATSWPGPLFLVPRRLPSL